jgi:hypothetical protein
MLITRRTSGRSLGTMKSVLPWMSESTGQQNTFQRCIVVGVRTVVVSCTRGARIHLSKLPWCWHFVRWLLVFVDPHRGTCIKSLRILRWLLDCWKTSAALSYTKFHHSSLSGLGDTCGRRGSVTVNVTHCQCQCHSHCQCQRHCHWMSLLVSVSMSVSLTVTVIVTISVNVTVNVIVTQCQCHSLSMPMSLTVSVNVTQCQCNSLSLSMSLSVSVTVNVAVTVNVTVTHCHCLYWSQMMYGSPVSSNESCVAMCHFYVQQRGFFH